MKKGKVDKQGLYSAEVAIRNGNGKFEKKFSTFFPDSWGEAKIINEIQSAHQRHVSKGNKGLKFTERSASGILITIELGRTKNGVRVMTAFPKKKL